MVVLFLTVVSVACSSAASPNAPDGSVPHPIASEIGSLTVRPDTGTLVVGRHLRVVISGADASGVPIDVGPAEITSSNPLVAQFLGAIVIPITNPATSNANVLSATFDLTSVGSTAIRARLGILVDSIVISVIPPT
jgi:hypothetical protein